ncbi:sulfatase [Luteolibacter algae]|uniref:Sulfatase n=1 Tax=Luteolibacter algae TaxID=454151 RepID=A0ABW5D4M0_9BACT
MKSPHNLKSLFLYGFGLLMAAIPSDLATAGEKPNILVILADDLGYGDVGFTGAKDIRTPNLDKLAANGISCTNAYVTHAYCGPSRAGLITGRYQARFGLEINLTNSPFDTHSGLPLSEKTFATRLKKANYRTGIIGKWHLGAAPPFHPNERGFDYFYGFLSGGHSYFPSSVTTTRPLTTPDGDPIYTANEGSDLPLSRNNKNAEFEEYLTTALSKDAVKFVKKGTEPFCLYLAYNAPHQPLQAPEEIIAKYSHIEDKNRRVYAAIIDEMDCGIGMIVAALKESGKFENTLIFFLSDNGASMKYGKTDRENYSSSGPFRDGKGSMREGGSHVPYIVHWPAKLKNPGKFDGLVSSLDIAATAVALGGGDTSGEKLEGVNLIPYLTGETTGSPHSALFWRENNGKAWAVRTENSKFLMQSNKKELYDMSADPYEKNNILEQQPERRAELAKLWNEWNAGNKANEYLQAEAYQRARLKFYEDLRKQQLEKAAKVKPLQID